MFKINKGLEINRVHQGDCLELMKQIPDKSIDMVLTDPPYEIIDMSLYFKAILRVLSLNGSVYIFGNKNIVAEHWFSQLKIEKKELLIWHYKNSPKPKGRWRMSMQAIIYGYQGRAIFNEDNVRVNYNESTKKLHGRIRPSKGRLNKCYVYDTSKGALPRDVIERPALLGHLSNERVGHPDQKPLTIIQDLILASSNENDLILDVFAGSGTTGVACKNLNRNFILIEKEERYCEIARERIAECSK